jgi:uncharacterized Zn-binding protein involved in type VI secretion
MGLPAARISDMLTPKEPIIGPGAPNVLILGLPASCMGDAALGEDFAGPVTINCSPTVLIGGRPACRLTSMANVIIVKAGVPLPVPLPISNPGAPTVLIGP